jgi:alkylhydroperoxidase family enzyme
LQGADDEVAEALRRRDIEGAPVSAADRVLLRFVKLVTESAYGVTAEETQKLRDAGWSDPQMAEAVYITALFAFFNRVADAFGLEDPGYTMPEERND